MKKVFLTIGMFVFSLNVLAQHPRVDTRDYLGVWAEGKEEDFLVFFWDDPNGDFKAQQFNKGDRLIIRDFKVNLESVYLKSTLFSSEALPEGGYDITFVATKFNYYELIDPRTMKCESTDEETNETITTIYRKIR